MRWYPSSGQSQRREGVACCHRRSAQLWPRWSRGLARWHQGCMRTPSDATSHSAWPMTLVLQWPSAVSSFFLRRTLGHSDLAEATRCREQFQRASTCKGASGCFGTSTWWQVGAEEKQLAGWMPKQKLMSHTVARSVSLRLSLRYICRLHNQHSPRTSEHVSSISCSALLMQTGSLQTLKLPVLYNIQISEHIKLRFTYLMSGKTDNIRIWCHLNVVTFMKLIFYRFPTWEIAILCK